MTIETITVELSIGGETREIDYDSVSGLLGDAVLMELIDSGATCRLRLGDLVLTGRNLSSGRELLRAIADHSSVLMCAGE